MGKLFSDDDNVIKIRGLPWSTTVDEIIKFFDGVNVRNGRAGVHLTSSKNGRPSGEAFIELDTEEDVEQALQKDKEHMGRRYIEVFKVNRSEMEWVIKHAGVVSSNALNEGCIRMRGLPYESTKEDIEKFFSDLEIIPNGITIAEDYNGRPSGEAYVQFVDKDTADKALLKHKEKIGHRYIELFRSTLDEIRSLGSNDYVDKMRPPHIGQGFGRPTPYDRNDRFGGMNRFGGGMRGPRGGGGAGAGFRGPGFQEDDRWRFDEPSGPGISPWLNGMGPGSRDGRWVRESGSMPGSHMVHMRGLPFRAKEADIADFFSPIVPRNITLQYENSGRPSGEADVEFSCHEDAVQAMSKDKSNMQHRYIELFLNSSGNGGGRGNNSAGPGPRGNASRFDGNMFERRNNRPTGGFGFNQSVFDY